jgi:hypothetical protein
MNKEAVRIVKLGSTDFTVKCEKTLLKIEGDIWEGRCGETICDCKTRIEFTVQGHDFSGRLEIVDAKNPVYKRFAGNYGCIFGTPVGLKKESYDLLAKAVSEVEAEASFAEYDDYVKAEKESDAAAERTEAEQVIAKADAEIATKGKLMTAKEIAVWNRNYNNVMNEGGEGYIPEHVSKEMYEDAVKTVRR